MAVNKNFVVKNGLEVNQSLILANAETNKVGIGTSVPNLELQVLGGIGATTLRIGAGASTGEVLTVLSVANGLSTSLVGVGTTNPLYLLDIRSPVSTGQTALYVQGDVRITGDLNVDDLSFDTASLVDLYVSGIATVGTLGVVGSTTSYYLQVIGISTFDGFSTFNDYVYVQDGLNVAGAGATLSTLNVIGVSTFRSYGQFLDNVSLYFGDGLDLNIYHDGSNSYIQEQGTGNLYVQSSAGSVNIRTNTTENSLVANQNGSVELYYDNAKKFETLGVGATVTGTFFTDQLSSAGIVTASSFVPTSGYIKAPDGTNSFYIYSGTGNVAFQGNINVGQINSGSGNPVVSLASSDASFVRNVTIAGVTTLASSGGITTTGGDLYVGGDLFVRDDLSFDSFTAASATVTGVTTLGNVTVSTGIITAVSGIVTYYGDGQYLTNVTRGVGLGTTGGIVGYGATILYFQGPGISTITVSSGIATVNIVGGGSGSASIGIGTTPGEAFVGVVTAGNLWYNSNLGRMFIYYQDQDSAQWVDASPSNVGVITSLINVSFAPGSSTSPSMYFVGDTQTGFFSPGAGQFTVVSSGSSVLNVNQSGIRVTGVATAQDFDALSDVRYKENINTVNSALLKVDQLRGVKFNWKESGQPSYGVIAQELEEVLPELVHGDDPKTVNYNGIIGVLIEAIKELKAEIEELKSSK